MHPLIDTHREERLAVARKRVDARHKKSWLGLGNAWLRLARHQDAFACYDRAISLDRGYVKAGQARLMALQYVETSAERLRDAQQEFSQLARSIAKPRTLPHAVRAADQRLRIGYLSPDFRNHSVAFFALPILTHHDRGKFHITCYHVHGHLDQVSVDFKRVADAWVPCARIADELLAQRIREDGIDILVDLVGHTSNNRLTVLAQRPAPMQVEYLGYPSSTGLTEIDYRLTDWHVDPQGAEQYAVSRPLRLAHSYFCYRPAHQRAVTELPALTNGYITFGSFCNAAKLSEAVLDLWARVLHSVPDARLLIKNRGVANRAVADRVRARFADQGVHEKRLTLVDWSPTEALHQDGYDRVDISLDSFPYNGATTTCEALWKGVPLISRVGQTHASRMGLSILSAAGLPELALADDDAFVAKAVAMANDLASLADMRAGLRERLRSSALMDEPGFTRDLERAYREAWKTVAR